MLGKKNGMLTFSLLAELALMLRLAGVISCCINHLSLNHISFKRQMLQLALTHMLGCLRTRPARFTGPALGMLVADERDA